MGNRGGGGYPQNSGVLVVLVCSILIPFFFNFVVACRLLYMWTKIMIPMYRLWLHGLSRKAIELNHSLTHWSAPSHYLHQCWNIVIWTFWKIFQWSIDQNSIIFIQENLFENVVRIVATILFRPHCVNPLTPGGSFMVSWKLVSIDSGNVLWPDWASSCYLSQCWQIVFAFHQRVSAAFVW